MSGNQQTSSAGFAQLPILSTAADYTKWAMAIRAHALLTDCWPHVSGEGEYPQAETDATSDQKAEYKAAMKEWDKFNNRGMGLILRTTSEDLQLQLSELKQQIKATGDVDNKGDVIDTVKANANTYWEYLKDRFEKKDGINAIINFGNLTRATLSDANPMETQIANLVTQRSRLATNGFKLEDHVFAAIILLALPSSFESIQTHFLDGLDDPTSLSPTTVIARIIEKDARSRNESPSMQSPVPPKPANQRRASPNPKQRTASLRAPASIVARKDTGTRIVGTRRKNRTIHQEVVVPSM